MAISLVSPGVPMFYIKRGSRVIGPFDQADIKAKANSGTLFPTDQLSKDRTKWVQADQVKGLVFKSKSVLASGAVDSVLNQDSDDITESAESTDHSSRTPMVVGAIAIASVAVLGGVLAAVVMWPSVAVSVTPTVEATESMPPEDPIEKKNASKIEAAEAEKATAEKAAAEAEKQRVVEKAIQDRKVVYDRAVALLKRDGDDLVKAGMTVFSENGTVGKMQDALAPYTFKRIVNAAKKCEENEQVAFDAHYEIKQFSMIPDNEKFAEEFEKECLSTAKLMVAAVKRMKEIREDEIANDLHLLGKFKKSNTEVEAYKMIFVDETMEPTDGYANKLFNNDAPTSARYLNLKRVHLRSKAGFAQ